MKKLLFLNIAMLCFYSSTAQNEFINYKALVSDVLGNPIISQSIHIRFTIFYDGTQVYQEVHNPTTTADGFIIVDIGNGTTTTVDTFININWYKALHSIKTEIDITGTATSYIDMGTTDFKSVPYALDAPGLYNIYNSASLAWRLERNPTPDGAPPTSGGLFSVDMTFHDDNPWEESGASGDYSLAANYSTLASGDASTAFGFGSQADGFASAVFGFENLVGGDGSFAIGYLNEIFGTYSFLGGDESLVFGNKSFGFGSSLNIVGNNSQAFGTGLMVSENNAMAIGSYNTDITNTVFMVGNGTTLSSKSNALTVYKDGTITAPSLTNPLIITTGAKSLVTKEYVDTYGNMGLYEVAGTSGWRLEKNPTPGNGSSVASIGSYAVDMTYHYDNEWFLTGASGSHSLAANSNTLASGYASSAFGEGSRADGIGSAAFGEGNLGEGDFSFVMGSLNEATGIMSFVLGKENIGAGDQSVTAGKDSRVNGNSSFTIGTFNLVSGDNSQALGSSLNVTENDAMAIGKLNVDETNAVFMVGNGTSFSARSNALTVLKNGKTTVNQSTIGINDHAINGIKTHTTGNSDAAGIYGKNTVTDYFGIGVLGEGGQIGVQGTSAGTGVGVYTGVRGISTSTNSSPPGVTYGVYGYAAGANVNYAVYAEGNLFHTGTLSGPSDRKLKTNIQPINDALSSIKQLNPKTYKIKKEYVSKMNMPKNEQIGFIAQELQQVFPNLVSTNKHSSVYEKGKVTEYLGVNYISLIPILTAGIKEQQVIIDEQQQTIESQRQLLQDLLTRVEALENH